MLRAKRGGIGSHFDWTPTFQSQSGHANHLATEIGLRHAYNSQLARGECKTSTQFPRNISFDPETYAQTIFKSVENEII